MSEKCEVSVICVVFNQENYICDALNGILQQQTEFKFEILIHDDASTDGTERILKEYQEKYPQMIHLIMERENMFSKGKDFFADMVRKNAKGKYIACCEGDDYWVDGRKLQLQYETLEAHSECDMCACRAVMVSEDKRHMLGEVRPITKDGMLPMKDVILGGGGYLATAGLFFRRDMYDHMLEFEKVRGLDYAIQMKGALRGGIYYIDQPMVAYRRYAKGSQTALLTAQQSIMQKQCEQEKKILQLLDRETYGKYHMEIAKRLHDYEESFYDQLIKNRVIILERLKSLSGKYYMWGRGLRGKELERFCMIEKLLLDGVCDISNKDIGGTTEFGYRIVSTDETLKKADVIMTSVTSAYEMLVHSDFKGTILNMQEYMPRA